MLIWNLSGFQAQVERLVGNQLQENEMSLGTILLILLVLMLIGAFPRWGYSSGWGYAPSGVVGLILVVVLILLVLGRI